MPATLKEGIQLAPVASLIAEFEVLLMTEANAPDKGSPPLATALRAPFVADLAMLPAVWLSVASVTSDPMPDAT